MLRSTGSGVPADFAAFRADAAGDAADAAARFRGDDCAAGSPGSAVFFEARLRAGFGSGASGVAAPGLAAVRAAARFRGVGFSSALVRGGSGVVLAEPFTGALRVAARLRGVGWSAVVTGDASGGTLVGSTALREEARLRGAGFSAALPAAAGLRVAARFGGKAASAPESDTSAVEPGSLRFAARLRGVGWSPGI